MAVQTHGAVGNNLKEKDINLNIAFSCKDYLEANGVTTQMSRYSDETESLNEKIVECNRYNPDLCLDIHTNAGGGDGFEVFHSIHIGTGKTLAENIEKEVIAIGQNSRGVKTRKGNNGDYYGFIRDTKAPAVICEGFFVDNATDAQIGDTVEEQRAFGQAYARGILKTLGIVDNPVIPGPKNKEGSDEEVRKYINGTTPEPVYSDTNLSNQIGQLNPYEECDCFGILNNRAIVKYKVDNVDNYKIGFCKWLDGIR